MPPPDDTPANPLAGHELIVFGPDWNRHPSTGQHLTRCFLENSKVIWVETVGLRKPALNLHDIRRSTQKITDFLSGRRGKATPDHPNLRVLSPPTLPFTGSAIIRRFNRWSVSRAVRKQAALLGFRRPALMVCAPSHASYIGHLGEAASIYLNMDDYALWPGMDAAHIARMEAETIRRVDAVVAVSDHLARRFASSGKPIHVISQGVDLPHFSSVPKRPSGGPFEVVFFGMLDDRLDQDLLVMAASSMPEAVFRLMGPAASDVSRLCAQPNIRVEKPVSYSALPAAVASADAFILPFVINELTVSCTPLKLKEYLACGRPVVSTALPESLAWQDVVHVGKDHADFIRLLTAVSQGDLTLDAAKVTARLQNESWQAKATELAGMIQRLRSARA